jgi:hypothetical protein
MAKRRREIALARDERPGGQYSTAMARGSPREDGARDMARLGGARREDLVPDSQRGASSPLGHGTGSKRHEPPPRRKDNDDQDKGPIVV